MAQWLRILAVWEGHEFRSEHPHKKLGTDSPSPVSPALQWVETRWPRNLWAASLDKNTSSSSRKGPYLKGVGQRVIEENTQCSLSASDFLHKHKCTFALQRQTHVCTQLKSKFLKNGERIKSWVCKTLLSSSHAETSNLSLAPNSWVKRINNARPDPEWKEFGNVSCSTLYNILQLLMTAVGSVFF